MYYYCLLYVIALFEIYYSWEVVEEWLLVKFKYQNITDLFYEAYSDKSWYDISKIFRILYRV